MEWREVPSLPEYMASSSGFLMRKPHLEEMPYGGVRSYGGVPTRGQWAGDCRRYILRYKGRTYKVARLICEAFHGPPPFPNAVCMHIDEDSRNNCADNLQWATQKQNLNCPGFLEYCRSRTGERNPFILGRWRPFTENAAK